MKLEFIAGLGSTAAWPVVARAQQGVQRGGHVRRISIFRPLCAHTAPNFRRKEF
jgi:hypothetical protein